MLQTLFALEHNAICDRLRAEYPSWSDDELFDHARLINAALLAKIHTVEWTTAILGHPDHRNAMRANWWGLAGEHPQAARPDQLQRGDQRHPWRTEGPLRGALLHHRRVRRRLQDAPAHP